MFVEADRFHHDAETRSAEAEDAAATEPRSSSILLKLVLGLVEERGADCPALLAGLGAADLDVQDPALRMPASLLATLLDAAAIALGDDDVALHAGQRADAGRLGILGLL